MIGNSHDCLKCGAHFSQGCPCVDEPLKPEDIVPGSIIRFKSEKRLQHWLLILGVSDCRVYTGANDVTFEELLTAWEIKRPGEEWKPCRQPYPREERKSRLHPNGFWHLFHYLWGKSKDGAYDKAAWIDLQTLAQIHGIK